MYLKESPEGEGFIPSHRETVSTPFIVKIIHRFKHEPGTVRQSMGFAEVSHSTVFYVSAACPASPATKHAFCLSSSQEDHDFIVDYPGLVISLVAFI